MKILIVGNSQVGTLNGAYNCYPALKRRLSEARFYCVPGGAGQNFLIENGRLSLPQKFPNPNRPPFADPADTIDLPLDYYGCILVSALGNIGGGFDTPIKIYRWGEIYGFGPRNAGSDSILLSRACYREIIRAEIAAQPGVQFLAKLKSAFAGRIFVQPFPRVSAATLDRADWSLRAIYQDPVGVYRFFSETRDEFLAELCADLDVELLPYPVKTLRDDHLTPCEYIDHPDGLHPNKEYARMVLEDTCARLLL